MLFVLHLINEKCDVSLSGSSGTLRFLTGIYLQFSNQTDLFVVLEGGVKLKQSGMLEFLHDVHLVDNLLTIHHSIQIYELSRQHSTTAQLPALLHLSKLTPADKCK